MKLSQYINEIEHIKQKGLVYLELEEFLKKFLPTDTNEPELFIPIGSGSLTGSNLEYEKTVPIHIVAEVLEEISAAKEELEEEVNKKLNETIG